MATLFQQKKSLKTTVDDTTPLSAEIKTAQKNEDHMEYIISVNRGPIRDAVSVWQITKRYSDFEKLDALLKVTNVDLPLPPKKMFGNFEREFIAARQTGLQNYLHLISTIPQISNSINVKRFLDSANYSQNFLELALQHVSMIFRSEPNWDVVEPLPGLGWRLRKHYILVKPLSQPKQRQLLSWVEYGPDMCTPVKELNSIIKLLPTFKHPNLYPALFSVANENGAMLIQDFHEEGSLRDFLCRCRPKGNYLRKYTNPKTCQQLPFATIQTFGRQILEVLKFLHDKGFPYGHLHAGNVIVSGQNCCLVGLGNSLLGLPGYYRAFYTQMKKVQTLESIDVYCFGHVLYEMAFGRQLDTPNCDSFPPECPAPIRSVLESILTTEACKNGLPIVTDLLSHPLFSDVVLSPQEAKPVLKIPSKLKEFLRAAKEEIQGRLGEDNKLLKKVLRISKAKEFHMSEEEKKKRRRSRKKALENGEGEASAASSSGASPSTPAAPSTPATPSSSSRASGSVPAPPPPPPPPGGPPAPPPPPPPAPSASAPPPPPPAAAGSGRSSLLSSISGFSKGGLKKTQTNDKSVPKV